MNQIPNNCKTTVILTSQSRSIFLDRLVIVIGLDNSSSIISKIIPITTLNKINLI